MSSEQIETIKEIFERMKSDDPATRQGANGGSEVLNPLIGSLKDQHEIVRYQAAWSLWKWANIERYKLFQAHQFTNGKIIINKALVAVQPLIDTLRDENADVRFTAARALAEIGDSEAYTPIAKVFEEGLLDPEKGVAEILGKLGGKSALSFLNEMSNSTDAEVRQGATYGYYFIHEDEAVRRLIQALQDEDEAVRGSAAFNLTDFMDLRALKALIEALKDHSNWVRLRVVDALGMGYFDYLDAIPPLVEALEDEDLDIREVAEQVLGDTNMVEVIELLAGKIQNGDKDLKERTIRILEKLSLEASGNEVKLAAKEALNKIDEI